MGSYGAGSPKATILYSNTPHIQDLWMPKDSSTQSTISTVRYDADGSGNVRVHGTPDLKGTEAYPVGFGSAVGSLFVNHRSAQDGFDISQISQDDCSEDRWPDAQLESVFLELQRLVRAQRASRV